MALAFCTWLAAHELDPAYRTWGLAVASLVGMVVVLRTLAICYRLYQAKDEPPVTNIAPAYRNAPLPDNRCPVCGRRLSADKHATLHCPGSRCGYRWPQ